GAVGAEEAVDGAARHQQVDSVDRDLLVEPFGQTLRGDREVAHLQAARVATHEPASAAYRPSGVTAPATIRPSSVSSTEKTVPAIRCPEPQLPETLGSSPTNFVSWSTFLSALAPAAGT